VAREDLDDRAAELARTLRSGVFGENLTTGGLDVTGALIGERWRIDDELILEVSAPRIPCDTFAGWMEERGWVKRFTRRARPGAYFRVVSPGRGTAAVGRMKRGSGQYRSLSCMERLLGGQPALVA
jgi:MOSC domain-containing protein YiiM